MGGKFLGYEPQNDGYDYLRSQYLGKEVKIFPGDTYSKFGIVRNICPAGITFEITSSNASSYKVGALMFLSFQSKLTFSLEG